MKRALATLLIPSILLSTAGERAAGAVEADLDARVDRAVAAAVAHLWRLHEKDRWPEAVGGALEQDFGARTALCVYALLSAGADAQDERLARTFAWLARTQMKSVYARSFRLLALTAAPPRSLPAEAREMIDTDLAWLLAAPRPNGAYDFLPADGSDGEWDNFNTHLAHLAVWSAVQRGRKVSPEFWRRARQHWRRTQTGEGGWSFDKARKRAYGSTTAAGLTGLYLAANELGDGADDDDVQAALAWLGENFSAVENPRRGPQYFTYWLWTVEQVGRHGGYAFLGEHNWYAEAAAVLGRTQSRDGGWGDLVDTCFALAFLGHGRQPILFSKLRYRGAWNRRPRDLANLTRWIGRRFERPVRWQVVNVDSPVRQWETAPILYISGASTPRFTDAQLDRLRRYARRGGLIVSDAAGASPAFNVGMRKVYARLFPSRPLRTIEPTHPIFSTHRPLTAPMRLSGVSNGVRLLAIHSPTDLAKAWRGGDAVRHADSFQLAANLYFHATDFGVFGRRTLAKAAAPTAEATTTRTIRIIRLAHEGNADPEPGAFERLADLMARRRGVHLEIVGPTPIAQLPAGEFPIALITGTEAFTLNAEERAALRAFINAGGLLVADAAGGSEAFDAAARRRLLTLVDDVFPRIGRLSPQSAIYRRPGLTIDKVAYRRAARRIYGDDRDGRLQVVSVNDRPAIIYSRDDLTAGLVGYQGHNLRGYAPASAWAIMRNLILYAADRPRPAKGVLEGFIDVKWKPAEP